MERVIFYFTSFPTEPNHPMSLSGKIALVTGASRGIGAGIALALAKAGADVVCAATKAGNAEGTAAKVRALGRRALAVGGSVDSSEAVAAMFDSAEAELGPVGILVNNAGIAMQKPVLEMAEADYDRIYGINAKGVFLCSQRAARAMISAGGENGQDANGQNRGAIINIGSIAGENAFPNRLGYCGSKAAVNHMTRVMAIEWAGYGIRVNCVAPGYIRTDIVAGLIERGVIDEGGLTGRTPQRRLGEVGDVAAAVVYLAGDGAGYVTGTVLNVDGGWDAYGYV